MTSLTQRVAAAQLWFLSILCCKLVADAIEQLDITLLRVLLHRIDESPRHGTSSLRCDGCIGPVKCTLVYISSIFMQNAVAEGSHRSNVTRSSKANNAAELRCRVDLRAFKKIDYKYMIHLIIKMARELAQ